MPILEIATAIAIAIGSAIITSAIISIVVATIDYIYDWFDQYLRTRTMSAHEVGFTVETALKSGKVKIVQGIFDTRTNKVLDGRVIEAQRQDAKLSELHTESPVVIYN